LLTKGVSEYIATLIATIITLAAGLGVFVYTYTVIDNYYLALSQSIEYAKAEYRESLEVMASYIRGVEAIVIAVAGGFSVDISAVYINNTLSACRLYTIDGSYTVDGMGVVRIPSNSIAVFKCSVNGSLAYVKIVYRGGEVASWASKIV